MKDNKQLCVESISATDARRIRYFYSCEHGFSGFYKSHRALKKAEKPCDCMGGKLTANAYKKDLKARRGGVKCVQN